jgi:hypothetical protein
MMCIYIRVYVYYIPTTGAEYYDNEPEIGAAFDRVFRSTNLSREEVFVTGKVYNSMNESTLITSLQVYEEYTDCFTSPTRRHDRGRSLYSPPFVVQNGAVRSSFCVVLIKQCKMNIRVVFHDGVLWVAITSWWCPLVGQCEQSICAFLLNLIIIIYRTHLLFHVLKRYRMPPESTSTTWNSWMRTTN